MKTLSIIDVLFTLIYLPPRLVQLGAMKADIRESGAVAVQNSRV